MSLLATITGYEVKLALHIFGAVVWVGGGLAMQVLVSKIRNTAAPERLAEAAADAEFVGTRLFIPASLTLIVTGFMMVAEADWDWELWLVFALAVWIASFLTGAGYAGPRAKRLKDRILEHGADDPGVKALISRLFLISRIELVYLVLVIFDMTLKPGL